MPTLLKLLPSKARLRFSNEASRTVFVINYCIRFPASCMDQRTG